MTETEKFLQTQRKVMLVRLSADDIPPGVLTKVMDIWLDIENACANSLNLKDRKDG